MSQEHLMSDTDNKRSETRLDEKVTIFVEVCSASIDNTLPADVIICNSLDISNEWLSAGKFISWILKS